MIQVTPRRVAVMRLVAQGKSNTEIAATLGLSPNTVKVCMRRIMQSLELASRTQVAVYALKAGLISLEDIELPGGNDAVQAAQ